MSNANFFGVPARPEDNSTANKTISDVIGSKNDRAFSNLDPSGSDDPSLVGHLVAGYYHVHDHSRVYPRVNDDTPSAYLTVTGAGALTYGSWVEIAGFDSKTVMADVHFIFIGEINAVDEYTLQLGTGSSGSQEFWGECSFTRDTNQMRVGYCPIQGPPIPAGTKLWARVASLGGGNDTVDIRVYTHEYPSVTGN